MKFSESEKRNTKDVWYGIGLTIGAIVFLPAMIFILAVIKAFVISTLWHWYIVPFFHVADLPLAISFGISLLINFIIPGREHMQEWKTSERLIYLILSPAIVLLFGWIGTFFI